MCATCLHDTVHVWREQETKYTTHLQTSAAQIDTNKATLKSDPLTVAMYKPQFQLQPIFN